MFWFLLLIFASLIILFIAQYPEYKQEYDKQLKQHEVNENYKKLYKSWSNK